MTNIVLTKKYEVNDIECWSPLIAIKPAIQAGSYLERND